MIDSLQEVEGKILDSRCDWDAIDPEVAKQDTELLDLLREACLIESYFAVYTGKMMELFWDDVDATSVISIEAFEAFTHYRILKRYLDIVDYRPVTEEEVVSLRAEEKDDAVEDPIEELVNFMITEHFAAYFFSDLAERTDEPVLAGMLPRLANEEVSHSQFGYDLLKKRIDKDTELKERVAKLAKDFEHVGMYALSEVSNVKEDNIEAIQELDDMVKQLTGYNLSDI